MCVVHACPLHCIRIRYSTYIYYLCLPCRYMPIGPSLCCACPVATPTVVRGDQEIYEFIRKALLISYLQRCESCEMTLIMCVIWATWCEERWWHVRFLCSYRQHLLPPSLDAILFLWKLRPWYSSHIHIHTPPTTNWKYYYMNHLRASRTPLI